MNNEAKIISEQLSLPSGGVGAVVKLLDEGCTIPFISRYRKEATGNLDEVAVTAISNAHQKLLELDKRRQTVLTTIDSQGKLTPELKKRIDDCADMTVLEDLYLPYKPKRRTRAQIAREKGYEPVAMRMLSGADMSRDDKEAVQGAEDIVAELVAEDEKVRRQVRGIYRREAVITSKVVSKMKADEKAQKYSDYFDWSEPLRRCPAHRLLAMRRGEADGVLRVSISADDDECVGRMQRDYRPTPWLRDAVADSFKRLLKPSMETEFAAGSKERADDEAIRVFSDNLRQLLLAAPLGQKRVMAVDPGIRTGCKVVCLDAQGSLLFHDVIFPMQHPGRAREQVLAMTRKYNVEAIAVGNGTAGRDTADFLRGLDYGRQIPLFTVSEDGASVYSASETAREEFPDEDVTVRGAVSIGRRLIDPLAELVKIDPKSIGVGQYQHDVDQGRLKQSLDTTVELCVNAVGVNVNTASWHLLSYVSGLGPSLAHNIVSYRTENGPFTSRAQLKKVPRLGPSAFQQCAGFLRIPGARNPLDNTAVHPESYKTVEQMARDAGCTVADLIASKDKRSHIDLRQYVTDSIGMPTLTDIMAELEKPGRDPREHIEEFRFDDRVKTPDDLEPGMELPGIVTNITDFGAFVDIGVHQDGLVHISQLADRFVKNPNDVVKLHQHVRVKVLSVDSVRHRISLSMRL